MIAEGDLPLYPNFKPLTLLDKPYFDQLLLDYPGYSENDFSIQYCWEPFDYKPLISRFNNAIVLRTKKVTSNELEHILYPSRNSKGLLVSDIDDLISDVKKIGPIPSSFINFDEKDLPPHIKKKYDRNNYDYIFSSEVLSTLNGGDYKSKRYLINKFKKTYPNHTAFFAEGADIINYHDQILSLNEKWRDGKQSDHPSIQYELLASEKLLSQIQHFHYVLVGVMFNNVLIGYSLNNQLSKGYVLSPFGKYDREFEGIAAYIEHLAGMYFSKKGFLYINNEQDLGIPSLRLTKMSWHPVKMLRKNKYYLKDRK